MNDAEAAPYRSILSNWRTVQEQGDPTPSQFLELLVEMENKTIRPLVENDEVDGYSALHSIAPRNMQDIVVVQPEEIVSVHYFTKQRFGPRTTAGREGARVDFTGELVIGVCVGHPQWTMEMLALNSTNLPLLWVIAYDNNSILLGEDGRQLIGTQITIEEASFANLNIGGAPAGWVWRVPITLRYNIGTWMFRPRFE